MAKDYNKMAMEIVAKAGGPDNVEKIMHCMTRLRLVLRDIDKVDMDGLNRVEGVIKVVVAGGQHQVVIGNSVTDVYNAALKAFDFSGKAGGNAEAGEDGAPAKKMNPVETLIDVISGVFLPILPGLGAVGILKGILVGLSSLGLLSAESDTYTILYALADAFFYYFPIILAISAADKFKTNRFVALVVVCAMVYPDLIPGFLSTSVYKFFGFIPLNMIDYTSTVIPAIVVVWAVSKIYALFKKIVPKVLDMIFTPLLTVVVAFPLALGIIGPVTYYAGVYMAAAYQWAFSLSPLIAATILGLLWPITIVFGLHWGFIPIAIQMLSSYGYDTFSPITVASNFATMGAALAVFLKTKDKTLKEFSGGAAFSAIAGGITEPAVYGITLKYKRPFILCCLFTGIGGAIMAFANAQYPGIMTVSAITLPSLALLPGGMYTVIASLVGFFGTAIGTYFWGFNDSMLETAGK